MITVNNFLKPFVIDIIMKNEKWKNELYKMMKSPDWGEAMFGDWIKDKVNILKKANEQIKKVLEDSNTNV